MIVIAELGLDRRGEGAAGMLASERCLAAVAPFLVDSQIAFAFALVRAARMMACKWSQLTVSVTIVFAQVRFP